MSALAVVRPRPVAAATTAAVRPTVGEATGRLRLVLALAVIAVIGSALFGAVALNASAAQSAVEARRLELEVRQAERAHARLIVEVAGLEDPSRIRARALDLGLIPAPAARHLVLQRAIPADGLDDRSTLVADPLKPILTQER
jgi:cell division protein FtsL